MGKIGCWNKKRAVLAIFYCGCKQSKSFHIPPPDRREDKGKKFFHIVHTFHIFFAFNFFLLTNKLSLFL